MREKTSAHRAPTERALARHLRPCLAKGAHVEVDAAGSGTVTRRAAQPRGKHQSRNIGGTTKTIPAESVNALIERGLLRACRKAKSVYVAAPEALYFVRRVLSEGDGFAEQHRLTSVVDVEEKGEALQRKNVAVSTLSWLGQRAGADGQPFLSAAAQTAGERYHRDFTFAAMQPKMTTHWGLGGGGGNRGAPTDLSDAVLDARARLYEADVAVGPDLSPIVRAVCGEDCGLEETEKRHGLPRRSGKHFLLFGLNALARHYGYISESR